MSHNNSLKRGEKLKPLEPVFALAYKQHQAGHLQAAEQGYQQVLNANPQHFRASELLGTLYLQTKRYNLAVPLLQKAIRMNPGFANVHSNLGIALQKQQRLPEAEASFCQALTLKPEDAEAHFNIGNVLKQQNHLSTAETSYRQALTLKPDYAEAHNNLGMILKEQQRLPEAKASYQQALALKPNYSEAHNNLGNALQAQNLLPQAETSYRQALALKPDFAQAHNNLGNTLKEQYRLQAAEASYRQALSIKPDYAETHNNLGVLHQEQNRLQAAAASYQQALSLKPDYAQAHTNFALLLLLQGHYAKGWQAYEWRLFTQEDKYPAITSPHWDGTLKPGQTLYLQPEQGVGDEIMFASCLPDLLAAGYPVVVACTERLVPLFKRSFPGVEVLSKPQLSNYKPVPMGSLPRLYRQHLSDFPTRCAYLKADPLLTQKLRKRYRNSHERYKDSHERYKDSHERYQNSHDSPIVGISWRGGSSNMTKKNRSIALPAWQSLLLLPTVKFVCLQYGDVVEEIKQLPPQQAIFYDPAVDSLKDLDTFAAQVAACDLIISVDNTTVHMGGALGVPTWVIVNTVPNWRWLINRDDSPWYPSLRLFRQHQMEHWAEVFSRITIALEDFVQEHHNG